MYHKLYFPYSSIHSFHLQVIKIECKLNGNNSTVDPSQGCSKYVYILLSKFSNNT